MQSPINTRDLRLQVTDPRLLLVGNNYISLSTTSSQFKYGSDNVAQPSQSVVKATLIGALSGQTVTFSYTGLSPQPTAVLNTVTILPDSITGDFATITATLAFLGVTYTSSVSVSKVYNQLVSRIQRPIDLITSANDGTGYTLPSASNYLELYNGTVKVTSGVTYGPTTTTKNGLTVAVNTSTGQITVSQANINSWTTDSENFTLSAIKDTVSYNSIYTITKAKTGTTGATGASGAIVEISGLTTFYRNAAGTISPANATLTAVTQNITSPTYSWTVSGATPTSGTSSSITITPNGAGVITVSLTVNGSNLTNAITVSKTMVIVDQGIQGQTGARGIMSAYPSIHQWLPTGTTPTRPTSAGTYTWATGSYGQATSTTGTWYTEAPSNTAKGYTLWQITVPLTVEGTTTQSTLDWTSTSYAMRAIAVNGYDGGTSYLIDRLGSDLGTEPTPAEVATATATTAEPLGRLPLVGDIANILYSNKTLSKAYRCTLISYSAFTSTYTYTWALQTSYITGSLIVENSISGNRIVANSINGDRITANTINGDRIIAGTLTANKITGGTITSTDSNFDINIGNTAGYGASGYATGAKVSVGLSITRKTANFPVISANNLTTGTVYKVVSLGTTNWTNVAPPGVVINQVGQYFVGRGAADSGTGTVQQVLGSGISILDSSTYQVGEAYLIKDFPTVYIKTDYSAALSIICNAGANGFNEEVAAATIVGGASYTLDLASGNNINRAQFATLNVRNSNTGSTAARAAIFTNYSSSLPTIDISNQYASTDPNAPAITAGGSILASGDIRSYRNVIAYYSDDRLKTKLGAIPNALEKLNTLTGFYYEPNETAQKLGYEKRREVGVSAQDVLKILPEIIHSAPVDNQYLTVDYERLIPLIIEAIKELDRRTK